MNWSEFVKKLLSLDVIFGSRTKKLTGIPDSHKIFKCNVLFETNTILSNDGVPSWIKKGSKLLILGGPNDGKIITVVDVSLLIIYTDDTLIPHSLDVVILDGRKASLVSPDVARNSEQGTMYNVNNRQSGISAARTNHFHKISDIFNPEFDSPEALGKITISNRDHTPIIDENGNTYYLYPDKENN